MTTVSPSTVTWKAGSPTAPQALRSLAGYVIPSVDGHNLEAINAAIEAAKGRDRQTDLICCRTIIGYGSRTSPVPRLPRRTAG